MRIVSLIPSATEIVCALGLADSLVGITHECDYPVEAVAGKPVLTSSLLPASVEVTDDDGEEYVELPTAQEIDDAVKAALASGESLYRIDHNLLRSLEPDVVITQGLCDVCAINHKAVEQAVLSLEGRKVTVVDLEPTTLNGVLDTFRQIGEAVGKVAEAEALMLEIQARLQAVNVKATTDPERFRTLLLEWPDPPYSAGHWNPELLALANAIPASFDEPGKPSRRLEWQEILDFAPERIVLIACGFDTDRAIIEADVLPNVPGWFDLPAVKQGECYAVDGSAYFNRPGPRLADSLEILATLLHPEAMQTMVPAYSVRRFPNELTERPKE